MNDSNKTFKCEICDYSCSYNGSLTKHFASVHNAKKYKLGYKKQSKQTEKCCNILRKLSPFMYKGKCHDTAFLGKKPSL